jgi:hypothetical protein
MGKVGMCDVMLGRLRETTVAMGKRLVLRILSVYM